jgi:hypothetical protein
MKEKLDAIFAKYPATHAVTFTQLREIIESLGNAITDEPAEEVKAPDAE